MQGSRGAAELSGWPDVLGALCAGQMEEQLACCCTISSKPLLPPGLTRH